MFVSGAVFGAVACIAAPFHVDADAYRRDATFYACAVVGLWFVLLDGEVTRWEAAAMPAYYVAFVAFVLRGEEKRDGGVRRRRLLSLEEVERGRVGGGGGGGDRRGGEAPFTTRRRDGWRETVAALRGGGGGGGGGDASSASTASTTARTLLELVKAPLDIARALTIPTSEPSRWRPFVAAASVSCAPLPILFSVRAAVALSRGAWTAATLTCCIACIATWRSVRGRERPPGWWSKTLPLAFAASVAWISLLATELLEALTALGVVSGVSPAVLGVTVLAWGNSVGDLVSDVVVARGGAPEMAVAACHSSPLFNLCVGLGLAFCASHWRADFRRVLYTGSHTTTSAW
jgi:sodium/potassium/calcium exchanger 6